VRAVHVEAGLRSFNRGMPEEINRIVADHTCDLLLCPSGTAVTNLANEGIKNGVELVGDVMYDALRWALARARQMPSILDRLGLREGAFSIATVHRPENTENRARLAGIIAGLGSLEEPVLLPLHPRTRKAIAAAGLSPASNIRLHEPLGYLDMSRLAEAARVVLTDSGGLQKEAYWLGTPCVTLREETEWIETVVCGWNELAGSDAIRIAEAAHRAKRLEERPTLYGGDGGASARCVQALEKAHGEGSA
jgi:UDP-N-acetylglucosamine 2-epimerase